MNRRSMKVFAGMAVILLLSLTVLELSAHARAGGSRSMGSRGSRSVSGPASPSPRQQYTPAPSPGQPQAGGGFMRSLAGGLMGGMLGSLLFSSVAGAGGGMGGVGGGIGLFEILLLAGGGYLLYRYLKTKRAARPSR
jgi:predicted lipid-binding transport protein (Tim44 family)